MTVKQIEQAIERLSATELATFRAWFAKYDAARWDEQFEHDVAAGRLDQLRDEAVSAFRQGECREL